MVVIQKGENYSPRSNFTQESSNIYVIPGPPVSLARPRFSNGHVWDSQTSLKLRAGIYVAQQHAERPFFVGPLAIDIIFYMRVSDKTKAGKLRNGRLHVFKPDIDNLVKFIFDVCNGILYKDDCTIAAVTACKRWDYKERTEFQVTPLD